jgi:hypothetical protein
VPYELPLATMGAVLATIAAGRQARVWFNIGFDKNILISTLIL